MTDFMKEHGSFKIYKKGRVVVSILHGSWNLDTALRYFDEVKKEILTIADKPWGQLVNYDDWELAVPEVYPPNIEFHNWLYEHGLRFKAFVTQSTVPVEILKKRVKSFELVESRTFADECSAYEWLRSKKIMS